MKRREQKRKEQLNLAVQAIDDLLQDEVSQFIGLPTKISKEAKLAIASNFYDIYKGIKPEETYIDFTIKSFLLTFMPLKSKMSQIDLTLEAHYEVIHCIDLLYQDEVFDFPSDSVYMRDLTANIAKAFVKDFGNAFFDGNYIELVSEYTYYYCLNKIS